MTHLEYLISHGLGGDFGRFRASSPVALRRGQRVVVRGERGDEIGRVLRPASERHARWMPNTGVGALLRAATPDDERNADALRQRAAELLRRGGEVIAGLELPLALLDAEILFDGRHARLHQVRWQECDVRDLVRTLSVEFDLHILLEDIGAPPAHDDHGCGSCGSGGGCGSCGSGGCGSCGESEDKAHFAELREQMERRVTLL